MTDATERARGLLAEAIVNRTDVLNSLLANPDLLVDLALEADGLELHGWYSEGIPLELYRPDSGPALGLEPVYRRRKGEDGDGQ